MQHLTLINAHSHFELLDSKWLRIQGNFLSIWERITCFSCTWYYCELHYYILYLEIRNIIGCVLVYQVDNGGWDAWSWYMDRNPTKRLLISWWNLSPGKTNWGWWKTSPRADNSPTLKKSKKKKNAAFTFLPLFLVCEFIYPVTGAILWYQSPASLNFQCRLMACYSLDSFIIHCQVGIGIITCLPGSSFGSKANNNKNNQKKKNHFIHSIYDILLENPN